MLGYSAVSVGLSESRLGSVNRLGKFCCNTQVSIIMVTFSAPSSSAAERVIAPSRGAGSPRSVHNFRARRAPSLRTHPAGPRGDRAPDLPGASPSSQPHFLNPCIVLAENPGGSHTGGGREEGRGRSWGKRMRRKRRRRKTTSSPSLGRPVKVWRFLGPPGPGSREAPAPTLRNFPSARTRLSSGTRPVGSLPRRPAPGPGASS